MCCCWKTPASMPARKRTIPTSPKQVAALGDIFVNDAFSRRAPRPCHHRRAWRTCCRRRPAARWRQELSHLQKALGNPERPLMAVVGGAKVSTKIELLQNLVGRVEVLVIGGAMANTFLAAEGVGHRQIALRARSSGDGAQGHPHGDGERRRDPACPPMSWWPRNSRQAPPTAPCRSARSPPTRWCWMSDPPASRLSRTGW